MIDGGSQISDSRPRTPAIFLDRDGVIIENRANYVRGWEDVAIYPQALSALRAIRDYPYRIIVVTNQSVVGRGLIPLAAAESINRRLVGRIREAGGRVDGVFMCPHAPVDACACRKPRPGLLQQAAEAHHLDLAQSIMIGDALTDLQAGRAAGVGRVALVRTGRGGGQRRMADVQKLQPFPTFFDLTEALTALLESRE